MKKQCQFRLLTFFAALMALGHLRASNVVTNTASKLNTTAALSEYIRSVDIFVEQTSKWDNADQALSALLDASFVNAGGQVENLTQILCDAWSVVTNITTLETGVAQTTTLTNVQIIEPREILLSGSSPEQIKDPVERKAVETLYDARRHHRLVRNAHGKLEVMRAKHFDRATNFILAAGSGTNASSAKLRELINQSATNDFTITISNRLFLMK